MINIEIKNKIYKKLFFSYKALENIFYKFEKGKTYGLIGENGAGKTTLIKCILKLENYEGKITNELSSNSYSPDFLDFYSDQYSKEYLLSLQSLLKQKKNPNIIDDFLEKFYLTKFSKTAISRYSKGMKKKINLIQSLMQDVDLYIFDEPTDGLDPIMRRLFLNEIKFLKKNNKTVLLSTHRLEDLNEIADELLIFYKGKLIEARSKDDVYNDFTNLEEWYISSVNKFVAEEEKDNAKFN